MAGPVISTILLATSFMIIQDGVLCQDSLNGAKDSKTSAHFKGNTTKETHNETDSVWCECGTEGWHIKVDNLNQLKKILEEKTSLIKLNVQLQLINTSNQSIDQYKHEKYHWILDAKGRWINSSLIHPQNWLAIQLGMFQHGVYSYNVDLLINSTSKMDKNWSYQRCVVDHTKLCLYVMALMVWPNTTENLTEIREQFYHIRNINYILELPLSTWDDQGGFVIFLLMFIFLFLTLLLFPYFVLKFLSRPVPAVCIENGRQTRMPLSLNQLPIGFMYLLAFRNPSLHPFRAFVVFTIFMVFPNLSSLFHAKLVLFHAALMISFLSLLMSVLLHSKNKPKKANLQTIRHFPILDIPDIPEQRKNETYHKMFLFLYSTNNLVSFQDRLDCFLNYQKESLKIITNPRNFVFCSANGFGIFWQWLRFNWFWLFDQILYPTDYQIDAVLSVEHVMSVFFVLVAVKLDIFDIFHFLNLLISSSVVIVTLLNWVPFLNRFKFGNLRTFTISICTAQLLIGCTMILVEYVEMCYRLVIGLLIDPDIVGPLCFLLVSFIGIIIKASISYYNEYDLLFRLTVQAAENVYKDISEIKKNVKEDEDEVNEFQGVKYNALLNKVICLKRYHLQDMLFDLINIGKEDKDKVNEFQGVKYDALLNKVKNLKRYRLQDMLFDLIKYSEDGEPTINQNLFWAMVDKEKPWLYTLITTVVFQYFIPFTLLTLFIWRMFISLDASHLISSSGRSFLTIALAFESGIILAQRSSESDARKNEALVRQYQANVLAYALVSYEEKGSDKMVKEIVFKKDVSHDIAKKTCQGFNQLADLYLSEINKGSEVMVKTDVSYEIDSKVASAFDKLLNVKPAKIYQISEKSKLGSSLDKNPTRTVNPDQMLGDVIDEETEVDLKRQPKQDISTHASDVKLDENMETSFEDKESGLGNTKKYDGNEYQLVTSL